MQEMRRRIDRGDVERETEDIISVSLYNSSLLQEKKKSSIKLSISLTDSLDNRLCAI